MKRVFAILLAACLLIGSAWADEAWYCRTCGAEAASPFCPTCGGTRETTGLRDGEWVCVCGRVNKSKFCGKCGRDREEATAERQARLAAEAADKAALEDQLAAMQEEQAELEVQKAQIAAVQIGDIVTYGSYPQTAEGKDTTPIG